MPEKKKNYKEQRRVQKATSVLSVPRDTVPMMQLIHTVMQEQNISMKDIVESINEITGDGVAIRMLPNLAIPVRAMPNVFKRGFGYTVHGARIHDRSYITRTCDGCGGGRHQSLQSCASCQVTYYCSKDCQLSDWRLRHRTSCKTITTTLSRLPVLWQSGEEDIGSFVRFLRLPLVSTVADLNIDPLQSNVMSGLSSYHTVQDLMVAVVHRSTLDIHPTHIQHFDTYLSERAFHTNVDDFIDVCFWWCLFEALGIASPVRRLFVEMDILYAMAARFWSLHIAPNFPTNKAQNDDNIDNVHVLLPLPDVSV